MTLSKQWKRNKKWRNTVCNTACNTTLMIPPTRSAFQAGWKRMTCRIPRYPWQLTAALTVMAVRWLAEASCMSRCEWNFAQITARSIQTFRRTIRRAVANSFPDFTSWINSTHWSLIWRWCSVFSCFCTNLVVWGCLWPV